MSQPSTPRRSKTKTAMLIATLLWPMATAWLAFDGYQKQMADATEADQPGKYWVKVPMHQELGVSGSPVSTEHDRMTPSEILTGAAVTALTWSTPAWGLIMLFLLAVWFSTRR